LETAIITENYPFLQGGGELGERTRFLDWTRTSLGSPANCPQSLRTTVSIILSSKFPMFFMVERRTYPILQ
jgi:two-component system sensor histidine kinase VicK